MTWQFSLAGLLVGVLVGMTGMGGGSLMTPLLILVLRVRSEGCGRHRHPPRRRLQVDRRCTPPDARNGSCAARALDAHRIRADVTPRRRARKLARQRTDDAFQHLVGAALVVCGLGYFAKTLVRGSGASDAPFLLVGRDRLAAIAVGASCGFVVGLTSVGSGTFFGLAMLLALPADGAEDRRHRPLPRRGAALGRRCGPSRARERRPPRDGLAPRRLVPGVLIGSNMSIRVPERGAPARVRVDPLPLRSEAVEVPHATVVIAVAVVAALALLAAWSVRRAHPAPRRAGRRVAVRHAPYNRRRAWPASFRRRSCSRSSRRPVRPSP